MDRHGSIDQQLAGVPLFAGLDKKHLQQVARRVTQIEVKEGKTLTREGEHGNESMVILEVIGRREFQTMLHDNPAIATELLSVAADRIAENDGLHWAIPPVSGS
jgi:CRP-like cAMP-binding protein